MLVGEESAGLGVEAEVRVEGGDAGLCIMHVTSAFLI